jgi:hypothetical protein
MPGVALHKHGGAQNGIFCGAARGARVTGSASAGGHSLCQLAEGPVQTPIWMGVQSFWTWYGACGASRNLAPTTLPVLPEAERHSSDVPVLGGIEVDRVLAVPATSRCRARHKRGPDPLAPCEEGDSPEKAADLVVRDRIELSTFRFSGQPRQALCRPAKTEVTDKRNRARRKVQHRR